MIDLRDRCAGVDIFGLDIDPHETTTWAALIGGQRVQADLPAATAAVWREAATKFPQLTGAGAWGDRSHKARQSCHNTGRAVDLMTRDKRLGDRVLAWLLLHRARLGITVVIWWGRIYSAANKWLGGIYKGISRHKDHVHASVGCFG